MQGMQRAFDLASAADGLAPWATRSSPAHHRDHPFDPVNRFLAKCSRRGSRYAQALADALLPQRAPSIIAAIKAEVSGTAVVLSSDGLAFGVARL
jgi:hypothetical protein